VADGPENKEVLRMQKQILKSMKVYKTFNIGCITSRGVHRLGGGRVPRGAHWWSGGDREFSSLKFPDFQGRVQGTTQIFE